MALVVISDLVPPHDRGRYQGYFAGTMTVANALGPILGGVLTQDLSWRWIFWIDLPVGLVAWLLSSRYLVRLTTPFRRVAVDWIGVVLIIASITFLLISIGDPHAFGESFLAKKTAFIGAAVASAIALIWRQHLALNPLFPHRLFSNQTFLGGSVVISLMSALVVGLIVVIPLNYQLIMGFSPEAVGFRMVPLTSGTAIGSFLAGQLIARTGHYQRLPAIGAAMAALGCLLIVEVGFGCSLTFDVIATGLVAVASRSYFGRGAERYRRAGYRHWHGVSLSFPVARRRYRRRLV